MGKLFEAVVSGQAGAVAEVHRLLRGFARHVCRGRGPHGEAALDWEDVAQEAARRLLGVGLAQYTGAGSERSYLYSLVKTTVIQMSRAAARRQRREEEAVAAVALPAPPDSGSWLEVRSLLAALDRTCREIIQRALLQDESYADLAHDLGLAESSVRARLSRCLRKARKLAEDRGEP